MTEDQIINIFGNGQVNDAILLAKSNGFLTLAANFEKAIKHIEDTKEYSKHYMKQEVYLPMVFLNSGYQNQLFNTRLISLKN